LQNSSLQGTASSHAGLTYRMKTALLPTHFCEIEYKAHSFCCYTSNQEYQSSISFTVLGISETTDRPYYWKTYRVYISFSFQVS